MTLHETTEAIKKASIGSAIGIGAIIVLVILFRIGALVKNVLYPPKIEPPNVLYNTLTPIRFPQNATTSRLTYTINTESGGLPDFPDRLNIYPIIQPQPNFNNLGKAKADVANLGFSDQNGNPIPEVAIGNALYRWDEQVDYRRRMAMNIISFNFDMTSSYISQLAVLQAQNLSDQNSAIQTAKSLLDTIALFPDDIDLTKTQTPNPAVNYITYPQLFSIKNSTLVPASSLIQAQVIRVDFFQKDLSYDLDTGVTGENNVIKTVKMQLPIVYPHPPNSTMNFLVASGPQNQPVVVEAHFIHKEIQIPSDTLATYPIKTAQIAFDELKNGEGYIASFHGADTNILINNVYLAYYMGAGPQNYLMPIIVFEGDKGFFGYVSAVSNEWVK